MACGKVFKVKLWRIPARSEVLICCQKQLSALVSTQHNLRAARTSCPSCCRLQQAQGVQSKHWWVNVCCKHHTCVTHCLPAGLRRQACLPASFPQGHLQGLVLNFSVLQWHATAMKRILRGQAGRSGVFFCQWYRYQKVWVWVWVCGCGWVGGWGGGGGGHEHFVDLHEGCMANSIDVKVVRKVR